MITYKEIIKIISRKNINWNQKMNLMLKRDMNFRKDIDENLAQDFCYMYAASLHLLENSLYGNYYANRKCHR